MNPQYPLVFATLLMRLGVGISVTQILVSFFVEAPVAWSLSLFSIGSLISGVLLSATHLGRPVRFMNSFSNLSSLLSWEAILTPPLLIFMSFLSAGYYFNYPQILILIGKIGTLAFGVSLIYVTAKVYHLKARPAWGTSLIVYEFFISALCMGILGYLGIPQLMGVPVSPGGLFLIVLAMIGLVAEFVVGLYYRRYLRIVSATAFEALREKAASLQFYLWIILGLGVPFVLSGVALIIREIPAFLSVASFLSFFVGALFWRIIFFKVATPLKITPTIDMAHDQRIVFP